MTIPVVFTAAARTEILEARDWYHAIDGRFAERFDAELAAAVLRIGRDPLHFQVIHRDVRRALLRRFSHGLFFITLPDRAQVLAFLHTIRDPRRWRRTL